MKPETFDKSKEEKENARVEFQEGYECTQCGNKFEYEDDAKDCCAPSNCDGWLCKECNTWHEEKEDAINCCPEEEE